MFRLKFQSFLVQRFSFASNFFNRLIISSSFQNPSAKGGILFRLLPFCLLPFCLLSDFKSVPFAYTQDFCTLPSFKGILIKTSPYMHYFSLRKTFLEVAGQLSVRLKLFVGQERKLLDKNNRALLCLNTCLSIFSKYCKFDGKYAGNICTFQ